MQKCVFLDRDGVLNTDLGTYAYQLDSLRIIDGVPKALRRLKAHGYRLIVITNQAGIVKGLYTAKEVWACHQKIQEACGGLLDALYYAPLHPSVSESLARKPGTLLFERAIARFHADVQNSWMIGDQERDLLPAKQVGIGSRVLVGQRDSVYATHQSDSLWEAVGQHICPQRIEGGR